MELNDLFLAPIYLLIVYAFVYRYRNKHYKIDSPIRKYFIPAFSLKVFGAISAGLIYFFYYGDGDTVHYHFRTTVVYEWLTERTYYGFRLIFADPSIYHRDVGDLLISLRAFDTSAYTIVRISSIISLFTFCNYSVIAIFYALLSFTGIWKLFITFRRLIPELTSKFAIAILFIPSVFFWGSGVFKDTVTMGTIGWLTYCCVHIFIFKERSFWNFFTLLIAAYLTFVIKAYIVLCFLPSMLFWLVFHYQSQIKSQALKVLLTPMVLVITGLVAVVALQQLGEQNSYWSINEIQDRAKDMQWWHHKVKEIYGDDGGGGSTYEIGDGSFTASNLLTSFPVAVGVTLFGPPLWKVRNPVMLFASLESLVILFFTLRVLFSVGIGGFFRIILSKPEVLFMMLFSITFAFAVGFTSFNYGALVRYKIPCIPFFVAGLYAIQYYAQKEKEESRNLVSKNSKRRKKGPQLTPSPASIS